VLEVERTAILSRWRNGYRSLFGYMVLFLGTVIVSVNAFGTIPAVESTKWVFSALLGISAIYFSAWGVFLTMVLFAIHMTSVSAWIGFFQAFLAVILTASVPNKNKKAGFLVLLLLITPWCVEQRFVFLPLFLSLYFYRKEALGFSALLGIQTGLFCAMNGAIPGFTQLTVKPVGASIPEVLINAKSQLTPETFELIKPWFLANLKPVVILTVSMFLAAFFMEKVLEMEFGSERFREVASVGTAMVIGWGGLGYLSNRFYFAIGPAIYSAVLAIIGNLLVEVPSNEGIQKRKETGTASTSQEFGEERKCASEDIEQENKTGIDLSCKPDETSIERKLPPDENSRMNTEHIMIIINILLVIATLLAPVIPLLLTN